MTSKASNREQRPIFTFTHCGDGNWISELLPTIATPGIYIIVDAKHLSGKIALMRNRTKCGCAIPLHCPNIKLDSGEPQQFPCEQAEAFREAFEVFQFNAAPNFDGLIFAMRNTMGIDTRGMDRFCQAALECLAETEWQFPNPTNEKTT